jgi:response regulator RpfG family c-di-GMP phosphodiesterase
MTTAESLAEIEKNAGSCYDPRIVEILGEVLQNMDNSVAPKAFNAKHKGTAAFA